MQRRAPDGAAALVLIMRYIFAIHEADRPEDLVARLLAAARDEGKEEIMTAAEQLIERGREQGREQGLREMLLSQLRRRFGTLPDAAVARVGAAGRAELLTWSDRVLTAQALEDVLGSA